MEEKLISVIVPVYNVEDYIEKCIRSILNQTYTYFELLIINDGSKDNSFSLAKSFRDRRIRVFDQENMGLSAARNKGLENAKGEYITFIDADDYVSNRYLELLLKGILEYHTRMSVCEFKRVYENDIVEVKKEVQNPDYLKISQDVIFNHMFTSGAVKFVTSWGTLYHRSLWEHLRFPEGRIHEDEFVFHRLYYQADYVVLVKEELYYYLQRKNSLVRRGGRFIPNGDRVFALLDRLHFFEEFNIEPITKVRAALLNELIYFLKLKCESLNCDLYLSEFKKLNQKEIPIRSKLKFNGYYILFMIRKKLCIV